jgi:hypothetical protein
VLGFVVVGETAALVAADVVYTCVRIWGKYLYTSAATKAAVSPITTNLNT